jgi:hypothetical protein
MLRHSKLFYEKYSLNIINYKPLPSSILGGYSSCNYDEDLKIKMVNGYIEKDIRTAYFGGIVSVFGHEIPENSLL